MVDWTFLLNTGCALLLGIVIGLERQFRHHPAGLRTNALVTLGAALFTSMSALMDDVHGKTRIVSYVVSGLGFLGGGVILREGMTVRGMNTAATIWCSGAIGALSGSGFPSYAVAGTVAILFVHIVLRPIVYRIEAHQRVAPDVEAYYRLRVTCHHPQEAVVRSVLVRHMGSNPHASLQGLSTVETETDKNIVTAEIYCAQRNDRFMEDLVARISIEPNVTAVSWERSQG